MARERSVAGRLALRCGLFLAACIPELANAQNMRRLYDDSLLVRLQAIYKPNIEWNLNSLLMPLLTPDELQRLHGVRLVIPVRDVYADPLSYLSYRGPVPTISLSVFSIKFFDDVAVAHSWLETQGHSTETVIDYLGVLKYRASDFSDGRYPRPFPTLGIPPDAARAPIGGDIADKILKSGIVFVLAHELGHLHYGHTGAAAGIPQAQANEVAADGFAIELFRRMGIAPLGIVYLFQVPVYLRRNRGDFATDDAWNTYLRSEATHPLSGARLQHLGQELQRSPDDFLRYESDRAAARVRIATAAGELGSLGRLFDDPDLQRWHRIRAERIPLAELRPRTPGNPWIPR